MYRATSIGSALLRGGVRTASRFGQTTAAKPVYSSQRTSAFLSKGKQFANFKNVGSNTNSRYASQFTVGRSLGQQLVKNQTRSYSNKLSSMMNSSRTLSQADQFNLALSAVAGVGILSLAAVGYSKSETLTSYEQQVAHRMRYTYFYLGSGLAITAATARALFVSGAAHRIATMNRWAFLGMAMVGMIGTQMATRAIPYENSIPKHAAWLAFCGTMGAAVCPVVFAGGPIIMKAAAATGAVVSSLSLVSAAAPTDSFLQFGGPLAVGFGVVFAASLGRMWFPASPILYNVAVYGGAGIFSLFVMYDTQKILHKARNMQEFDPINNSLHVYMDTVNLFLTMVQIMQGNNRK